MSNGNQDRGNEADTGIGERAGKSEQAPGEHGPAPGYLDHVRAVFSSPDEFFETGHRSDRGHAATDLVVYAVAVFLAALFARVTGYSGWDFEFGYLIDAGKSVLTVAVALAGAIFGLGLYGTRGGNPRSTAFYIEKLGGGLLLPALLLVAAIVLDLLDIRIHAWLRGLAMALVYVLIFAFAYAYATPGRLKTAVGFLAGFYVLYRLMALLF